MALTRRCCSAVGLFPSLWLELTLAVFSNASAPVPVLGIVEELCAVNGLRSAGDFGGRWGHFLP